MRYFIDLVSKLVEGRDRNVGTYTSDQAREIGSCAIIAISNITGKTWDEVWEVAKPYFTRYGFNSGTTATILRHFGYQMDAYYKMPWSGPGRPPDWKPPTMTVRQAEIWLKKNDPTVKLWCSINVDRMSHAIAFSEGEFHNVLGAYKARLRLCYKCTKTS